MIAPLVDEIAGEYGDRLRTVGAVWGQSGGCVGGAGGGARRGMRAHVVLAPVCSRLPAALRPPSAASRPQLKLNTDESPNVATEYGIRSIPTVMVFKNGGWGGFGCVVDGRGGRNPRSRRAGQGAVWTALTTGRHRYLPPPPHTQPTCPPARAPQARRWMRLLARCPRARWCRLWRSTWTEAAGDPPDISSRALMRRRGGACGGSGEAGCGWAPTPPRPPCPTPPARRASWAPNLPFLCVPPCPAHHTAHPIAFIAPLACLPSPLTALAGPAAPCGASSFCGHPLARGRIDSHCWGVAAQCCAPCFVIRIE